MENNKLINSLQNLIRQNLFYAYQKNTSKVYFEHSGIQQVNNKIHILAGFDLKIKQQINLPDKVKHWRFPKSRLYYFEINSNVCQIFGLQYFDNLFLRIQNFNDKDNLTLELEPKNNFSPFYNLDDHNNNTSLTFTVLKNSRLFITNIKTATNGKLNPVKYFNDLLTHERKIHPLNNLQTEDNSFLQEVDALWAAQDWIDKNGNLDFFFNENDPQDKMAVLLFLEIFHILGKPENIRGFCEKSVDDGVFLQKIIKSLKFEKIEVSSGDRFTELLFNGQARNPETANILQETWNAFSTPARKDYCKNLLKDRPHEIAAFIILVFKNSFWWRNKATDFFDTLLKLQGNKYKKLWQLYVKLARNSCSISSTKQETIVSFCDLSMKSKVTNLRNDFLSWQIVTRASMEICKVKYLSYPAIAVDKKVTINYSGAFITISPFLLEHKTNFNNFCSIAIGNLQIKIFLVWPNFTVHIGAVRLKFLFKKSRYQISVKGTKKYEEIKIDGAVYSFENTLYHKIYKPVKKGIPVQKFNFYQGNGRKVDIKSIPINASEICIHGVGKNRFDQLVENVSILQNKSTKSQRINTLDKLPEKFIAGTAMRINVPKTDKIQYLPNWDKSLLSKIKNTQSAELSQQWIVFAGRSGADRAKILQLFFDHLGYYPLVKNITEINTTFNKYSLLISNEFNGEAIYSSDLYEEVRLAESQQKVVLHVQPENLEKWLNKNFWTVKNSAKSS